MLWGCPSFYMWLHILIWYWSVEYLLILQHIETLIAVLLGGIVNQWKIRCFSFYFGSEITIEKLVPVIFVVLCHLGWLVVHFVIFFGCAKISPPNGQKWHWHYPFYSDFRAKIEREMPYFASIHYSFKNNAINLPILISEDGFIILRNMAWWHFNPEFHVNIL